VTPFSTRTDEELAVWKKTIPEKVLANWKKSKHCKRCDRDLPRSTEFFPIDNRRSKDKLGVYCLECVRATWSRDKESNLKKDKERRIKLRQEVLAAYGNRCKCCGEDTFEFLAIDHIHTNGKQHRDLIGSNSYNTYRWLKRNGFPEGGEFAVRVLCHSCNNAFAHYGYCPHQEEKKVFQEATVDA